MKYHFLNKSIISFNRRRFTTKDTLKEYKKIYSSSIEPKLRENFWENEANDVSWFKKWDKVLDSSNPPFYKWYTGGKINMSYNCIDRHIENGLGDSKAIIWESAYLNKTNYYSYSDTLKEVSKISKLLIDNGVKKGDVVIIYMPMIPEAIFSMLACTRIGAIHSVVFGGFAAEELSHRIKDTQPKMIITSSAGIEPKKKIPYFPIIKEALGILNNPNIPILYVERNDVHIDGLDKNYKTLIYQEEMDKMDKSGYDVKPVPLDSNDPLYILYTSGTTGAPKGIVRDVGGTCVALNFSMKNIMDINAKDVYFATSDIGWVVGHSFIVYGPLIRGATTICYEGKPIGTPNCGKFWHMIDKYQVKSMFTSPTAIRAIKKEDHDSNVLKSYKLSSLKSFHVAGERCDPGTLEWITNGLGPDILVNDNWWQTETGWQICSNNVRMHTFPTIPGAAGIPVPGYDIRIFDTETNEEHTKPNEFGNIYIKLPLPPSFMIGLWNNNNQAFAHKYITPDNQYYITGDAGLIDENGMVHIMSRIDDVINVAGHRLSTGRIEEVLTRIDEIVEAAVVSVKDEIKGEVPFAFIVCKNGIGEDAETINKIKSKAMERIVHDIGAISRLKGVIICHKLPKTRSGKILRNILKKIINGEGYKIPPAIEDHSVLDEISILVSTTNKKA